jgi:hypothetical protein
VTTYAALVFLPLEVDDRLATAAVAWLGSADALHAAKEAVGGFVIAVNAAFILWLAVVLVQTCLQTLPREQLQAQWQRMLQVGSNARALVLHHLGVHESARSHSRQRGLGHTDSEVQHRSAAGSLPMLGGGSASSASQRALQRLRALTHARFKDVDIDS